MSELTNTYTNIGPLTTIFTPPASCSSVTQRAESYNFGHWGGGGEEWDCYPSFTSLDASVAFVLFYYSPAIYCPSGWATANTALNPPGLTTSDGVTAALCCPIGYSTADGTGFTLYGDHQCSSAISSGQVMSNLVVDISEDSQGFALSQTTTQYTFAQATAAYGDGILMLWDSSDLKQFGTVSTIATTALSHSGTNSQTPANTNTSTSTTAPQSPPAHDSPLSAGAKAGIAVGIVSVFVITILGIFFCFRRRNKRQNTRSSSSLEHAGPNEIAVKPDESRRSELFAGSLQEMSLTSPRSLTGGSSVVREADSERAMPLAEMPTSPVTRKRVPNAARVPTKLGERSRMKVQDQQIKPISDESRFSQGEEINWIVHAQGEQTPVTHEMSSSPIARKSVSSFSSSGSTPTTSGPSNAGESSKLGSVIESSEEEKLRVLQDRIEKIREEKSRLERIQELKELEEQTKQQILEQQKRNSSL